jgi:hypothetical protein
MRGFATGVDGLHALPAAGPLTGAAPRRFSLVLGAGKAQVAKFEPTRPSYGFARAPQSDALQAPVLVDQSLPAPKLP